MSKQTSSATTHSPRSSSSDGRTSSTSSADEGISSGDCETSDDDEYIKETTPLNENNGEAMERGGMVGVVQQVISAGFSSFFYVCI